MQNRARPEAERENWHGKAGTGAEFDGMLIAILKLSCYTKIAKHRRLTP